MEKQTNNQKRMLLYSLLALTIGIVTILPLSYITITNATNQTQPFFTPYLAGANAIPNTATLYPEPYMTVNIGGIQYYHDIPDEGSVDVQVCYHITPNGANLKDVDAKIEVYNVHYYSDKGSILNITQLVAVYGNVPDPSTPNSVITAIIATSGYAHYDTPAGWANHKDTITFADGTVYDVTNLLGYTESRSFREVTTEYCATNDHCINAGGTVVSLSKGEKSAQALNDLRNAQTIYVEVTRIMQITYKHPSSTNPSSVISATPITSNKVLCHIQLPKLDDLGIMWYNAGLVEHKWVDFL